MGEGVIAAWVSAAVAAAGAATSAVQQRQQQKQQQRNAREQLDEQKKQQSLQDEQWNKANAKKANIEGLLDGNADLGEETNLTGAQGQTFDKNTLGSANTLGGM